MSSFLERLRDYLERVERAPEGLPFVHVDVAAHWRHLVEEVDAHFPASDRQKALHAWKQGTSFPAFVNLATARLLENIVPDASAERLAELINRGISFLLEGSAPAVGGTAFDGELEHAIFWAFDHRNDEDACDGWMIPARYAFETRLVRRNGSRVTLSRSGTTLLELPGIEAVRWLLTLEVAQSLGPTDDWRLSPDMAATLLQEPELHEWMDEVGTNRFPYSRASLRRLAALQLLTYHRPMPEHEYDWGYDVLMHAKPLLEEAAGRRSTPFTVLANALLRDDLDGVLDRLRPAPLAAAQESAAGAVALQARMVVHEVRNALIPTQVAFSSLVRNLGDAAEAESVQKPRNRIESGIQRALTFVDDMLRVANLGVEPPATFDATTAVREAVSGLSSDLNGNLRFTPSDQPRPVTGPRARFVLAIANLLRNAAQAIAGTNGRVDVTFGADDASAVIHVDDSGPGVPAEQRRAIFEPGVALRSGGSGQGLALVRQVIEGEMGGTVTCEDGPLGGARFTIVIPARSSRDA